MAELTYNDKLEYLIDRYGAEVTLRLIWTNLYNDEIEETIDSIEYEYGIEFDVGDDDG